MSKDKLEFRRAEIVEALQNMGDSDLADYIICLEDAATRRNPEKTGGLTSFEKWWDRIFATLIIAGICFSVYKMEDQPWANVFLMVMIAASRLGTTWEVNKLRKELEVNPKQQE